MVNKCMYSVFLRLLQEETVKQTEERVNQALMERDEIWQQKMSDQEMAHQDVVGARVS